MSDDKLQQEVLRELETSGLPLAARTVNVIESLKKELDDLRTERANGDKIIADEWKLSQEKLQAEVARWKKHAAEHGCMDGDPQRGFEVRTEEARRIADSFKERDALKAEVERLSAEVDNRPCYTNAFLEWLAMQAVIEVVAERTRLVKATLEWAEEIWRNYFAMDASELHLLRFNLASRLCPGSSAETIERLIAKEKP